MKNIVNICVDDSLEDVKYNVDIVFFPGYDFQLTVYYNGKKSIDEVMPTDSQLKEVIDKYIDEHEYFHDDKVFKTNKLKNTNTFINDIKLYMVSPSRYLADPLNAEYNNTSSIEDYSDEEKDRIEYEYITSHDELKNKKVLVKDNFDLCTSKDKLYKKYDGIDKLYVVPIDSNDPIGLHEINDDLFKFVSDVKELGLSPFETVIFVYDFLREKPYSKEGRNQCSTTSRDLFRASTGDKIVCAGYSNIYSQILRALDIPCDVITLENKSKDYPGHARNVLRIEDDKYNIHGIFEADATMDARDSEDDRFYWLYSYVGFLRKANFYKVLDKKFNLLDYNFGFLFNYSIEDITSLFINLNNRFDFIRDKKEYENYRMAKFFVKTMLSLYLPISSFKDEEPRKLFDLYMKYSDTITKEYNEQINIQDFVKALAIARYHEHKINPDIYEYDHDKIFSFAKHYGYVCSKEMLQAHFDKINTALCRDKVSVDSISRDEIDDLLDCNLKIIIKETNFELCKKDACGLIKVVDSTKLYSGKSKKSKKK